MKKVNFYIDGFNFYFGLKEMCKHKPKWNKSLMESVIEINGKTYRKPTEWN